MCHLAPGGGRRRSRRSAKLAPNSCTGAAPSRRRQQCRAQPVAARHPAAEAEHVVQPDNVADELGGERVTGGDRVAASCRQSRRPPRMRPYLVTVIMPGGYLAGLIGPFAAWVVTFCILLVIRAHSYGRQKYSRRSQLYAHAITYVAVGAHLWPCAAVIWRLRLTMSCLNHLRDSLLSVLGRPAAQLALASELTAQGAYQAAYP